MNAVQRSLFDVWHIFRLRFMKPASGSSCCVAQILLLGNKIIEKQTVIAGWRLTRIYARNEFALVNVRNYYHNYYSGNCNRFDLKAMKYKVYYIRYCDGIRTLWNNKTFTVACSMLVYIERIKQDNKLLNYNVCVLTTCNTLPREPDHALNLVSDAIPSFSILLQSKWFFSLSLQPLSRVTRLAPILHTYYIRHQFHEVKLRPSGLSTAPFPFILWPRIG